MIFNIGNMARQQASNPLWRAEVRDLRNRLENYYNSISENAENLQQRIKLGLLLADMTRDLTAYDKALELYNNVLKHLEALPEADRNSIESRRIQSSVENGIGSCYLARRKANEALPHYEKALELDTARYKELAPADGAPLPTGKDLTPELETAAEDLLSSYRCLGECQYMANDPEEARDTYKQGRQIVLNMKNINAGISMQYVRLLSALGNLESSCGNLRQAAEAWAGAGELAQRLRKASDSPAIQAQTTRYLRELENSLKSIAKPLEEMRRAEAEQQADAEAELPQ